MVHSLPSKTEFLLKADKTNYRGKETGGWGGAGALYCDAQSVAGKERAVSSSVSKVSLRDFSFVGTTLPQTEHQVHL